MTVKAVLGIGCKIEEWLFQTRTPAKEIAFWIGWLTAASIFTNNLYQSNTLMLNGEKLYKTDIVKDFEYREAAVVLATCQVIYLIDTIILAYKKAANYLDCTTYIIEIAFWAIIASYGFLFDGSKPCEQEVNIFTCVFRAEIKKGRWPYLWILPAIKLTLDFGLFLYFRFWQKRLISYSHGQSIVGLLLDVQYLLVILWISDDFATSDTSTIVSRREIYDAKLVFVILFKGSMAAPLTIIFCGFLARFEFGRGYRARGVQWSIGAVTSALGFILAFLLDATIGSITAEYLEECRALCTVFICLAGLYGLLNAYFKLRAGYQPYLQYFTLKMYPVTEKSPLLLCSQTFCRGPAPASVDPPPSDRPGPEIPANAELPLPPADKDVTPAN